MLCDLGKSLSLSGTRFPPLQNEGFGRDALEGAFQLFLLGFEGFEICSEVGLLQTLISVFMAHGHRRPPAVGGEGRPIPSSAKQRLCHVNERSFRHGFRVNRVLELVTLRQFALPSFLEAPGR